MNQLDLTAIPNQQISVTLESSVYDITIKETNGVMCATVVRDGVAVVSNNRILPLTPIIPYQYLEQGNLFMTTSNEELPYYTAFGVTQFLYYVGVDELVTLRAT